jgi:hypothetical protein
MYIHFRSFDYSFLIFTLSLSRIVGFIYTLVNRIHKYTNIHFRYIVTFVLIGNKM